MRDFGPINKDAEAEAANTLFFVDGEFEGKPYRASTTNYLAFLSMRGEEIPCEIKKIRETLNQYPPEILERDIVRLLTARNWRYHNIACVAMACGFVTEETLSALWQSIRAGSWVSPQLSATALYIDPNFKSKASNLISNESTYFKSIISLASLLNEEWKTHFPFWDKRFFLIRKARKIDKDNSGAIASGWLESLRNAFDA